MVSYAIDASSILAPATGAGTCPMWSYARLTKLPRQPGVTIDTKQSVYGASTASRER